MQQPLHLGTRDFRYLLARQGPSLGLWRAAEIAALREQVYERPILDLGCGDGLVTSLVLNQVEVGLDPDWQAVERAARLGIYNHFEVLPAEASQLAGGCMGTIVSNSVLEHLPAVDAVLAAVARLLRPGGRFIFTTPTETFSAWLALPWGKYAAWRNRSLEHRNLWPVSTWIEHLGAAGLEIEFVRPYLRRTLVWTWDVLELLQQVWLARWRVFGLVWRSLPSSVIDHLGGWAATLDLSALEPGGGRLIVARKR